MKPNDKSDAPEQSEEFEKLVVEKKQLWAKVKDKPDFRETEQYRRIEEIDTRLWELVKS
ncbi:hypothetical protein [Cohnella kolymensis]|uniref:hypothetical protein n=1 Tax=Cohnella kolymensis TaxID=1590652 RepID=UPI000B16E81C|nr:hypothetical protein [Cohnella kolymensis]